MGIEKVSLAQIAAKLRTILEGNREEIEAALLARIQNTGLDFIVNVEGLVGARPSASEYLSSMIESFEQGEDWKPALPPAISAQVRYAARQGVSLEEIIRGVGIASSVFLDAVIRRLDDREALAAMKYMATWQRRNLDQVTSAFATTFSDELERINQSPTRECRKQVRKLVEGGPTSTSAFDYRLDLCHIALIATGKRVDRASKRLSEAMGCDLLLVPEAENTYWVWLGAPRQLAFSDLERAVTEVADSMAIAAGEPREGVVGWRLSHLEAEAAAPVAELEGAGIVRHSNVALLASALCREEIGHSLIKRYLDPLERHRDAEELRSTLRVYFELSCNAASTASSIGVNRHTVQRRLKRVEEAIGEPAAARQAEFGVALRLQELTARTWDAVS